MDMDKEMLLTSGLLQLYVLGLTSPEESRKVEEHARAFPEIQELIQTLQSGIYQYAVQRTKGVAHNTPPRENSQSDQ